MLTFYFTNEISVFGLANIHSILPVSFDRSELKVLQMKMKEYFTHAEDEFSSAGCPNHCKHHSLSLFSSRQLPEFSVFHYKYPRHILSVLYKTSQFSSGSVSGSTLRGEEVFFIASLRSVATN